MHRSLSLKMHAERIVFTPHEKDISFSWKVISLFCRGWCQMKSKPWEFGTPFSTLHAFKYNAIQYNHKKVNYYHKLIFNNKILTTKIFAEACLVVFSWPYSSYLRPGYTFNGYTHTGIMVWAGCDRPPLIKRLNFPDQTNSIKLNISTMTMTGLTMYFPEQEVWGFAKFGQFFGLKNWKSSVKDLKIWRLHYFVFCTHDIWCLRPYIWRQNIFNLQI